MNKKQQSSGPLTEGDMLSNVKRHKPSNTRPMLSPPGTEPIKGEMVEKRSWDEFRQTKLLWWINRILHTFGWAIALEAEPNGNIVDAYPIRIKLRGFDDKTEAENFIILSEYLAEESKRLIKEAKFNRNVKKEKRQNG